MREADKTATLAAARAVLANVNAGRLRREWAKHVLAWLERGDAAAARALGVLL